MRAAASLPKARRETRICAQITPDCAKSKNHRRAFEEEGIGVSARVVPAFARGMQRTKMSGASIEKFISEI